MEILPFKRFASHSQSANGLKPPFGVKNDKYGPYHGADIYKNDTLSRILKMIPCSAARPRTEIHMSTPPPRGNAILVTHL